MAKDENDPNPATAAPGTKEGGFPEPPGPGSTDTDRSPHEKLNHPIADGPDPTEWPDPYDRREDPRDLEAGEGGHTGATSSSQPHPDQDVEAPDSEAPERDKLDD